MTTECDTGTSPFSSVNCIFKNQRWFVTARCAESQICHILYYWHVHDLCYYQSSLQMGCSFSGKLPNKKSKNCCKSLVFVCVCVCVLCVCVLVCCVCVCVFVCSCLCEYIASFLRFSKWSLSHSVSLQYYCFIYSFPLIRSFMWILWSERFVWLGIVCCLLCSSVQETGWLADWLTDGRTDYL